MVLHIFRVENSAGNRNFSEKGRQALFQEMVDGRLRQGWGREGTALLDKTRNRFSLEAWTQRYLKEVEHWGAADRTAKKAKTHYDLLSNMLDIHAGDRIVVPNIAKDGWDGFVIATAIRIPGRPSGDGECYGFSRSVPRPFDGDRRHFVAIDPVTSEFISYDSSTEAAALKALIAKEGFWNRTSSVDPEKHPKLVQSINKLSRQKPSTEEDKPEPKRKRRSGKGAPPPTPTQQERGLRGEKEIMRRLQLKRGCLGLKFVEDHRSRGWGYDILCTNGADRAEVEVKTFQALNGQIFFTDREFRRALESKDRYHLWALLDNGRHPRTWKLITLKSPHSELKRVSEKRKQIVYRIVPSRVQWEERTENSKTAGNRASRGKKLSISSR
jgi:hypothetical protein